jgi:hypothetical protein
MPRYTDDGNTKVVWAQVADKDFPAQSELNAGYDVSCLLTGDGLNITTTENAVDDAALCETFDAELPGTFKVSSELTIKRKNTVGGDTDEAWLALATRGETGALVVRPGIPSDTAWTAGQPVEVYPGTLGQRRRAAPTRNTQARFMISIYGSEEPGLDAVVVAS